MTNFNCQWSADFLVIFKFMIPAAVNSWKLVTVFCFSRASTSSRHRLGSTLGVERLRLPREKKAGSARLTYHACVVCVTLMLCSTPRVLSVHWFLHHWLHVFHFFFFSCILFIMISFTFFFLYIFCITIIFISLIFILVFFCK